jgi:LPXTG-motif cell wall-anchored protein
VAKRRSLNASVNRTPSGKLTRFGSTDGGDSMKVTRAFGVLLAGLVAALSVFLAPGPASAATFVPGGFCAGHEGEWHQQGDTWYRCEDHGNGAHWYKKSSGPSPTVKPPSPSPTASARVEVSFVDDCEATNINAANHTDEVLNVTIAAGKFAVDHKLQPGGEAHERFQKTVGEITVTAEDLVKKHTWDGPTEHCAPPSSPGASSSAPPAAGPALPVTGSSVGVVAGVGAGLLAAGAAFLVVRRRVRFTAD